MAPAIFETGFGQRTPGKGSFKEGSTRTSQILPEPWEPTNVGDRIAPESDEDVDVVSRDEALGLPAD
jgi:hypothetical protein